VACEKIRRKRGRSDSIAADRKEGCHGDRRENAETQYTEKKKDKQNGND